MYILTFLSMLVLVPVVIMFLFGSFYTVGQQEIYIIERLGKFHKISRAGLGFKIPVIDRIVGEVDLRVEQLNTAINTKTSDNVFVDVGVSVQYLVNGQDEETVKNSFYKLSNREKQFSAYILDTVRSKVPTMTLDNLFSSKDQVAQAIAESLGKIMAEYGFSISTALVTTIEPDKKVVEAMNEINTARRLQEASTAKGEADKIIVVKKAEAEAEAKILQGKGIAGERQAIVEGLKKSASDMEEATGLSHEKVMEILLTTQYFDTLSKMGAQKVVFLSSGPDGLKSIGNQIRESINA